MGGCAPRRIRRWGGMMGGGEMKNGWPVARAVAGGPAAGSPGSESPTRAPGCRGGRSLLRQGGADDLLVVAREDALVGECRVAPNHLAAERGAGRLQHLPAADLGVL